MEKSYGTQILKIPLRLTSLALLVVPEIYYPKEIKNLNKRMYRQLLQKTKNKKQQAAASNKQTKNQKTKKQQK
jgi:hypothetical protein